MRRFKAPTIGNGVDEHAVESQSVHMKHPGGRPPAAEKMKPLGIHLSSGELEQLTTIANDRGLPLATTARLLLVERLKEFKTALK